MIRHVLSKWRVACELVVLAGVISWAVTVAVAGEPRPGLTAALKPNAALAPRFDPSQPTRLDEFTEIPQVKPVHFDFDKAAIRPADAKVVDSDARWLKANPPYEIVIGGYADQRGNKEYNVKLAKRRAMSVKNGLVARGIDRDRIALVSYGKARPECHAKVKTDACWARNRRADILVRRVPAQAP